MARFIIQGGTPLHGPIEVSGSKNATLPILAACLLTEDKCVLDNVPDIKDVHTFLQILQWLGVTARYHEHRLEVEAKKVERKAIPQSMTHRMRASILLLGPLIARLSEARLAYPGGCFLGKRPVSSHTYVLQKLGAAVCMTEKELYVKTTGLQGADLCLPEMSVTATENAIMASVLASGKTKIRLAAAEPHIQDLCHFLNSMGAQITGIGTHTLEIGGVKELHGTTYGITADYLETGTMALASLITNGKVTLHGIVRDHLEAFWQKLEEVGAKVEFKKNSVTLSPTKHFQAIPVLKTSVWPGFATDLQAPFAVLLTQAGGESRIFETLFEGRLNYLAELEKMGAKVKILSPHEGIIYGPRPLRGTSVASCDIRAGAAMVLAALVASGTTEITDIDYIDRGYERLDEKLRRLGARIERIT